MFFYKTITPTHVINFTIYIQENRIKIYSNMGISFLENFSESIYKRSGKMTKNMREACALPLKEHSLSYNEDPMSFSDQGYTVS